MKIVKKKPDEDSRMFEERGYANNRNAIINLEEEQEKMMTDAMKVVLSYNSQRVIDYSMRSALNDNSNSLLFDRKFLHGLNDDLKLEENEKEITFIQYPIILKSILQWVLIVIVHF